MLGPHSECTSGAHGLAGALAQAWGGDAANIAKAQEILAALAKANGQAQVRTGRLPPVLRSSLLYRRGPFVCAATACRPGPHRAKFAGFVAKRVLTSLCRAPCPAPQLGQFKGPHPVPGGGRILQALRFGGAGK